MIDITKSKNRTALVGLGAISSKYKKGLQCSKSLNLVALMDIKNNPKALYDYQGLPFYNDFDKLINNEKLEWIIISTPPKNHYELIKKALNKGINVIIEKPMVLEIKELEELYNLAGKKKLVLYTAYHWQNGEEIKAFNALYDPSLIQELQLFVDDPYSIDGININNDKFHLEGTWIDSGVNCLSLLKVWFPFNNVILDETSFVMAKNINQPIYSIAKLLIDNIPATIEINWQSNLDYKRSIIKYDNRIIKINHSKQLIDDNDNINYYDSMDRLERHYFNLFTKNSFESNYEETKKIHRLLFEVKNKYEENNC